MSPNLPLWSKDLSAKDKERLMKDLNNQLGDEMERRENFFKDLDAIHKATKEIISENSLRGSPRYLIKILERLMRKSKVSYPDGMRAKECVH